MEKKQREDECIFNIEVQRVVKLNYEQQNIELRMEKLSISLFEIQKTF